MVCDDGGNVKTGHPPPGSSLRSWQYYAPKLKKFTLQSLYNTIRKNFDFWIKSCILRHEADMI